MQETIYQSIYISMVLNIIGNKNVHQYDYLIIR